MGEYPESIERSQRHAVMLQTVDSVLMTWAAGCYESAADHARTQVNCECEPDALKCISADS